MKSRGGDAVTSHLAFFSRRATAFLLFKRSKEETRRRKKKQVRGCVRARLFQTPQTTWGKKRAKVQPIQVPSELLRNLVPFLPVWSVSFIQRATNWSFNARTRSRNSIYLPIDADRHRLSLTFRQQKKKPKTVLLRHSETETNAPKLDVDVSERACVRACDLHELQQHRGSKSFTSSRRLGLACEAFFQPACLRRRRWAAPTSPQSEPRKRVFLPRRCADTHDFQKNTPWTYGSAKLSGVLSETLGHSGCSPKQQQQQPQKCKKNK